MRELKELKAEIGQMSERQIKDELRDKYGYDERYLYYLDKGREVNELTYCILEKEPDNRYSYPHSQATLPDGSFINRDGSVEHIPYFELAIGHGYTASELRELGPDGVYEEWCRVTGRPLSEDYIKRKERKAKRLAKKDKENKILRLEVKKWNG